MSGKQITADDEELNPGRYRGEEKTVGTIEEMMANYREINGSEEEHEMEAGAAGVPADD